MKEVKNPYVVAEDLLALLVSLGLRSALETSQGDIWVTLDFAGRMIKLESK